MAEQTAISDFSGNSNWCNRFMKGKDSMCILKLRKGSNSFKIGKTPGSRNCAAQQRALQIILDLADESSKRDIII